jgi:predicted O-methyltransferase YrrM
MLRKGRRIANEALAIYRLRKTYTSFAGIRNRDHYEYIQLPTERWGTKSHDFWVLLSVILNKVKPRSILELGSGRSTIYLSEYAGKNCARLVSVDQHPGWVAANSLICRLGALPETYLEFVPLQSDGFYSVSQLKALVDSPDFLFIDGPVQRGSTKSQMEWLTATAKTAEIIILDDVHRRHIFRQIEPLATASDCGSRWFHEYTVADDFSNCLCILANSRFSKTIEEAVGFLDFPLSQNYTENSCPQE